MPTITISEITYKRLSKHSLIHYFEETKEPKNGQRELYVDDEVFVKMNELGAKEKGYDAIIQETLKTT